MDWEKEFPTVFRSFQDISCKSLWRTVPSVLESRCPEFSKCEKQRQAGGFSVAPSPVENEPDFSYSYGEGGRAQVGPADGQLPHLPGGMGLPYEEKRVASPSYEFHHMFHRKATMPTAQSSCPGSPPDTEDGWEPVLCRGEINFGGSRKKRGKVGAMHA